MNNAKFALNAIQWINVKEDPNDLNSASLWRFADPAFVAEYPGVLAEIRKAGFDATMLEVLATQTLQNYRSMIEDAGLELAPGYVQLPLPSDSGLQLQPGSAERIHWFDGIRRRAEESNYFGLSTVFIAAEVAGYGASPRMNRPAVGADFSQDRLDEFVELVTEAAEVLRAEGIRAGLHNHVGTWVETVEETEYVLNSVDESLLGASFDIGHLAWTGADAKEVLRTWRDRVIDLHVKDLQIDIAVQSREVPLSYERVTDIGLFREPGLGDLDLVDILSVLPESFAGWILIEVDRASMDPVDSAQASAQWMRDVRQQLSVK